MTLTKSMQSQSQAAQPRLSTIVVATDFSDSATAALDWTIDLAKAHAAKIVLVHAVETELPALAESTGPIDTYVRKELETVSKRLSAAHVLAQSEFDRGKPWSVIAAIASKASADLIVVGAHGKSKFRMLGSVADRLIRTTSIPVLVHRARVNSALGIRTVLAATDFSEEANLAMETAMGLLDDSTGDSLEPARGPARLVLFHIVPLMNLYDLNYDLNMSGAAATLPAYWDDMERAAAQRLETLAAALRSHELQGSDQLQVEVKTLRGYPSEAILHEAEITQADLIALGTVGRSGLNQFFMGSVAQRVLHHAKCPVLVVRKPEPALPDEQSGLSIQP
jgi:nucleotide-binding universal stress UspA family protein